jgi:hypothetical protein
LNAQAQEQHERNVLRLAKALREVAVCFDAEDKLFEELRVLDASVRLRPMRVNAVGSVRDYYSRGNMFLGEIQEFFPGVFNNWRDWPQKAPTGLPSSRVKNEQCRKNGTAGQKGGQKL